MSYQKDAKSNNSLMNNHGLSEGKLQHDQMKIDCHKNDVRISFREGLHSILLQLPGGVEDLAAIFLDNECLRQKQAAMHGVADVQAEAHMSNHFAIAVCLAGIAREIDWNHDIPNKITHVEALHAMARKILGDQAEELYSNDEE
jgi:hypothetical protein